MKNIGIAGYKKLVMERLSNPSKFSDRTLVLWNADYVKYGIAHRVIKQCCEEYNKLNPDDQIWFVTSDMAFDTDDFTYSEFRDIYHVWDEESKENKLHSEMKRFGILFNTGCYLYDQEDKDNWFKLVNTHTNKVGRVYEGCVMIVCAQAQDKHFRGDTIDSKKVFLPKEEDFDDNCDIYCINPSIYEWANWAKSFSDPEILELVRTYIKKNGLSWGFDYWLRIMDMLERLKKSEDYSVNSIREIPQKEVKRELFGSVSKGNPAPDFFDFIYGNGW